MARDLGLRAHPLGHAEGLAEERVQPRADRLAGLGQREGVLHLAEDLRLADHHGVEAGRHAEGVAHGVAIEVRIEDGLHGAEVEAAVAAQVAEHRRPRLARRLGHAVHLDPVARGQDHELGEQAAALDVAQHLAQLVLLDRELLAQADRRVLVAEAGDEERHQEPCRPGRKSPAPSVNTSAAKPKIAK